jgi:hypothetical protein
LRTGELPSLTEQEKERALVALRQLLALRGIACEENASLAVKGNRNFPSLVIQISPPG